MEREQRSEGLLRDFIRANCQRMKHELAKRDCGLGQYHRDPRAAAAVILLQLHSRCVKRTHTITHTHTHMRNYHESPGSHTVSPLTGQKRANLKTRLKTTAAREQGPHPLNTPQHQARTSENLEEYVRVSLCVHVPPSLRVCFNCIHFSYRLEKKKAMIFFLLSPCSFSYTQSHNS